MQVMLMQKSAKGLASFRESSAIKDEVLREAQRANAALQQEVS